MLTSGRYFLLEELLVVVLAFDKRVDLCGVVRTKILLVIFLGSVFTRFVGAALRVQVDLRGG